MQWNPLSLLNLRRRRRVGAAYRRQHSIWLTRAVQQPPGTYPRIPSKRVDAGGFDRMLSRPGGRERAELWWRAALDRVDDVADRPR